MKDKILDQRLKELLEFGMIKTHKDQDHFCITKKFCDTLIKNIEIDGVETEKDIMRPIIMSVVEFFPNGIEKKRLVDYAQIMEQTVLLTMTHNTHKRRK